LVHLRAKGLLILFDRHYYDLLVDYKRYRYKRPLRMIKLLAKLIPRPDLVILLDAEPEVFYTRKQEVSFQEVSRQRKAYLKLVNGLSNGWVVDASRSLEEVADEVENMILASVSKRAFCRPKPRKGNI